MYLFTRILPLLAHCWQSSVLFCKHIFFSFLSRIIILPGYLGPNLTKRFIGKCWVIISTYSSKMIFVVKFTSAWGNHCWNTNRCIMILRKAYVYVSVHTHIYTHFSTMCVSIYLLFA